jgi:hypothetical protein
MKETVWRRFGSVCLKEYSGVRRMVYSGILRRVALVKTDVSEELSASFIRVTSIGELGTTLDVTSNRPRAKRCNIPEDTVLHSHRHENLKCYTVTSGFREERIQLRHAEGMVIACFYTYVIRMIT